MQWSFEVDATSYHPPNDYRLLGLEIE